MDFSRHIYATHQRKKCLHLKLVTCDISWHRLQNDSAVVHVIEENYSFESFVHKYTDILICTYSRYKYFMHNAILSPS